MGEVGVPGVVLILGHQPGQRAVGGQSGPDPGLGPGEQPVVATAQGQAAHSGSHTAQLGQKQRGGQGVVLAVQLPGLELLHELGHSRRRGQQESHGRRRHQGHVGGVGAQESLLRGGDLPAAPAQNQGQHGHDNRQGQQGQGGGRTGVVELGHRVQGLDALPDPQQETCRAAGQSQGGQDNVFTHNLPPSGDRGNLCQRITS